MNTETGKIRHLGEHEKPQEKETLLSPKEYATLLGFDEETRPVELALYRYIADRKEYGRGVPLTEKQAFREGWKSAKNFQPSSV